MIDELSKTDADHRVYLIPVKSSQLQRQFNPVLLKYHNVPIPALFIRLIAQQVILCGKDV